MLRDNIRPYLPQIIARDLTNRAVADLLGVSEGAVCRVLKQLKIVREPPANASLVDSRALNAARRAHRLEAAKTMSIKAAAAAAKCSERTIYRLRKQ